MKSALSKLLVAVAIGVGTGVNAFVIHPSHIGGNIKIRTQEIRPQTSLHAFSTKEPELDIFSETASKVETVPLNVLSFDGGGIKGAMSTRLLSFTLQLLLTRGNENPWTRNLVLYVESFKDAYPTLWTIKAQQLDSIGVAPQAVGKDGSKKSKWMDYSFDNENDRELMESMIKVDLAFEYYLMHVMSISGTSTGGLITLATTMRMSLTQLSALYMDPKTADIIFPKTLNPFRWGGWLQAKYTQDGINTIVRKITRGIAPFSKDEKMPPSETKFIETVDQYNEGLKARILGTLAPDEKNRFEHTLKMAKKNLGKNDAWVDEQLTIYEGCIKDASHFLMGAKMKRFRIIDGRKNKHSLERLNLKEPSARYDSTFFSTRFLVTSRCVNNGAAVIFDSHEPIKSKEDPMLARGALKFGDKSLDVKSIKVTDIGLCTSAAPYFFPAHQIDDFFFHDGGVMANDPGLINTVYSYGRFGEQVLKGKPKSIFPVFKLFRIGCGKEAEYLEPPIHRNTPQGAAIVTKLADIFMSSDAHRTDLLANVLKKTYILKGTKLDAVVPTKTEDHALPMDKVETLQLINNLFGTIDSRLVNSIVIPEQEFASVFAEKEMELGDLATTIRSGESFLVDAETEKVFAVEGPEDAMMLMRGVGDLDLGGGGLQP